jgi:tetratricopeptide (TPR) repeat protein
MAIRGSLREASVADVLQLLALGHKSGCLSVSDTRSFGRIYLERGRITHASIVNRRDRLGDLLVRNGLITAGELERAVAAQSGQGAPRLGRILVHLGAITREQLEHHIGIQVREAVYHLFTWTHGVFQFQPDEKPDATELLLAIDPESLLLEGARRVDEAAVIAKKIPSPDAVFALDASHGDPGAADLTPEQRRILPLLDGRHSVAEMIEECGLPHFDAMRALYGLAVAGYARPHGRKEGAEAKKGEPARADEHLNLGIAFSRTAMLEEAEREFRRVLELEPDQPEALFHLGRTALSAGDNRAAVRWTMRLIDQGATWASAFHQLALGLEGLSRHEDALQTVELALQSYPDHAALTLSRAILLLKARRPREAVVEFERYEAVRASGRPPPAAYFVFATVALAASRRLVEARRLAERGIELYPHVAPLALHLGLVVERYGRKEEAGAWCRRAVREDPALPQARRAVARLPEPLDPHHEPVLDAGFRSAERS